MHTSVVIAGAGPTGLIAACQCIRFHIDFILVDKKEGPTIESRALAIQARTLEIFEQMGIAQKCIADGYAAEAAAFFTGDKKRATVQLGNIGKV